jgi:hypothetical protein
MRRPFKGSRMTIRHNPPAPSSWAQPKRHRRVLLRVVVGIAGLVLVVAVWAAFDVLSDLASSGSVR